MDLGDDPLLTIYLPQQCWVDIQEHCRRKLSGDYFANESKEQKAFGLVTGRKTEQGIMVARVVPLLQNARRQSPFREYMDTIMATHAVPSETALDQRGWVADPQELMAVIRDCQSLSQNVLGAYHMHRVSWQHDQLRDTPTALDRVLGAGSRMIMFVISMVDPEKPVMRAFYEGVNEREIPVSFLI